MYVVCVFVVYPCTQCQQCHMQRRKSDVLLHLLSIQQATEILLPPTLTVLALKVFAQHAWLSLWLLGFYPWVFMFAE